MRGELVPCPSSNDPSWAPVHTLLRSVLGTAKVEFTESMWLGWSLQIGEFSPDVVMVGLRFSARISGGAYKPTPGMLWHVCHWIRQYGARVSEKACDLFRKNRLPNDTQLSFLPASWAQVVRLAACELAAPEPPLFRHSADDAFDWQDEAPECDELFPMFSQLTEELRRAGASRFEALGEASRRVYRPDEEPEKAARPERPERKRSELDGGVRVPIVRGKDIAAPEDAADGRNMREHADAVHHQIMAESWELYRPVTPEEMDKAYAERRKVWHGLAAAAAQGGQKRPHKRARRGKA